MAVQHSLCRTGLETPNTGFLAMRLKYGCVFRREALFCLMCLFLIRQKVVTALYKKPCHEETNFLPKPVFGSIQPGPTQTGL